LAEAGFITNEQIFDLPRLPARLAIIGGGPIGVEMAWAHTQLGSEVTLLEAGPEILNKDDPDMAAIVRGGLEADGARVLTRARVLRVEAAPGGTKRVVVESGGLEQTFVADELLVAAGRTPNIEKLALEKAGVAHDRRG